ncbi:hypothetical protein LINPERHAP2_LOCUS27283 [Linum perenne]
MGPFSGGLRSVLRKATCSWGLQAGPFRWTLR